MIPKKVYINIAVWDEGRKYDFIEVSERPHQTTDTQCHWREYTDLTQVWHDASEMPKEETWILATNEKDIIDVYHLRKGRKYNFDGNLIDWSKFVVNFNLTKWAYISDLLPKQFENSEQLKGDDNN